MLLLVGDFNSKTVDFFPEGDAAYAKDLGGLHFVTMSLPKGLLNSFSLCVLAKGQAEDGRG